MTTIVIEMDFDNKANPQYLREFATFFDTWLMNKYVGGGIKILDTIVIIDQTFKKMQILFVTCIHTIII